MADITVTTIDANGEIEIVETVATYFPCAVCLAALDIVKATSTTAAGVHVCDAHATE